MPPDNAFPLDGVAHVIQLALTPVFLLSGVGALLNVFNARLARVRDHAEHVTELRIVVSHEAERLRLAAHDRRLRRRTAALDAAVVMMALAGASACCAALALFMGALREQSVAWALYGAFGASLAFAVVAFAFFIADTLLAWHGLRSEGSLPRPGRRRRIRVHGRAGPA